MAAARDPLVKVMYLAPRSQALSSSEFRSRWESFGRLAMSLPLWSHIAGYAQCDLVDPGQAGIDPAASAHHRLETEAGGVGMIWFHSASDLRLMSTAPGIKRMRAAELELFGAANENAELTTDEHLVFQHDRPAMELISFVHRARGLNRAAFQRDYLSSSLELAEVAEPASLCCSCVQNLVLGERPGPDAVTELGFADTEQLTAYLQHPASARPWLGRGATTIDHARTRTVLVTRRVLTALTPAARS